MASVHACMQHDTHKQTYDWHKGSRDGRFSSKSFRELQEFGLWDTQQALKKDCWNSTPHPGWWLAPQFSAQGTSAFSFSLHVVCVARLPCTDSCFFIGWFPKADKDACSVWHGASSDLAWALRLPCPQPPSTTNTTTPPLPILFFPPHPRCEFPVSPFHRALSKGLAWTSFVQAPQAPWPASSSVWFEPDSFAWQLCLATASCFLFPLLLSIGKNLLIRDLQPAVIWRQTRTRHVPISHRLSPESFQFLMLT